MKKHKWTLGFGACLTAFTVFLALETFVLPSAYQENATQMNTAMFASAQAAEASALAEDAGAEEQATDATEQKHGQRKRGRRSETREAQGDSQTDDAQASVESVQTGTGTRTYQDENISVTLTETDVNGTAVYVADVRLSSAEYLKAAFAGDTYGRNITARTSEIAAANDAILAINGDYYGTRERGWVIRNGVVYRDSADSADVLCLYADGTMSIVDPATASAEALVEDGVWQAFSFGPALVEDGEISVSERDEVGRAMASNPRTAIGMIDPLHYVFVVSDGRTSASEGLSLYELAQFLHSLGAQTAYNLDGGGSSTMVFQGEVINNPTSSGNTIKERGVSDIVYIG